MRITLAKKIFLITFLIGALALSGMAIMAWGKATTMLRELSLTRLSDSVGREARLMQNNFALLRGDALFLAASDSVAALAKARREGLPEDDARHQLEHLFATVMQQRPAYTQLRLVGVAAGGREVVRVNRGGGAIAAVPPEDLQAKGDRYYFLESLQTPPGQVYVSRIDLNQEHGVIVEPHQPVFRVATPVVDADGRLFGAIIVNLDFDAFLGGLGRSEDGVFYVITNDQGDYLLHPDAKRRFAFELGGHDRLFDDYGLAERWQEWFRRLEETFRAYVPDKGVGIALDRLHLADAGTGGRPLEVVVGAVATLGHLEVDAQAFGRQLFILVLVAGSLSALALAWAMARLTRPIHDLINVADRIADGEREVAVTVTSNDETGILAQALTRMLDSLRAIAKQDELAAMGRMASMVAHDLRNALSSVKMNLQILGRHSAAPEGPAQAHYHLAMDQVQYMENILSDMLTFARPEGLIVDWLDLEDFLTPAMLSELPTMDAKGVTLEVNDLHGLPKVPGDRTKLIQVFQNLIDNAIQAVEPAGTIHVRTEVVAADPAMVQIAIEDNGAGIPPETLERIFEPFFTTRTSGTGLGLAIVKRVVDQHGGRIAVESTVGQGTRVCVDLPILGHQSDQM